MKHSVLVLGLAAFAVTPAAPLVAQWRGEPVWNSPRGGSGLTISGDYAHPGDSAGGGHTWGGRASLGLGTIVITAGVASWKPSGVPKSLTSIGGNVAMRLIGGSLLPVGVNLQVGAAHSDSIAPGVRASTRVTAAAGISMPLPTPLFSIEPYFSPGLRYTSPQGGTNTTEFGYAIGANVDLGLIGVHLAYDHENQKNAPSIGVFGVGAHLNIKLPLGM
jgi:hypothetical protein